MKATLRRWLLPALIAITLLSVVCGRVLVEGSRELDRGATAQRAGDVPTAVRHYRRAAHWYLPGSPYCTRAYEALETIATQAEAQGRLDHALSAWRAIRASALATQWLVVPQAERLARANTHIAALMAEQPPPVGDENKTPAQLREEHLSLLNEYRAPEPAWVVMLGIGLALWLGSLVWAARKGWDIDDKPQLRVLAACAGVFAFGLTLLLVGVARA